MSINAKARTISPGLCKNGEERLEAGPTEEALFVFLRLLLGRSKAFQALQKLFFGHPLDGHLGIVRIDGGSGGTDQRNCIGFRLVHFDEFLQRMDQFLAQILRRNGGIGNFA